MSSDDGAQGERPAAPARRRRSRKAEAREQSIERILDAAERLFAEFGYHGVTIKDIAREVGVSSTLLHYHFSGKDSIYEAMWARKAPISVRNRLQAMRRYADAAGDAITVEGALRAWIDTDLDAQINDPDYWIAFGKISAQANSAAGWGAAKMNNYFNPVVLALIDLLRKAMPECDERRIFWAYHFVSGAMTHNMARTGRLDELSNGLCRSDDFRSIKRYMARFMAAGIEAICRGPDIDPESDSSSR